MFALIQPFINLLLFRVGPQDMPSSKTVLKIAIAACFITDIIQKAEFYGFTISFIQSAGKIALYSGFIFLLLNSKQNKQRWMQTMIALLGASALLNLASYPFIPDLEQILVDLNEQRFVIEPGMLIYDAIQLWFFAVFIRILRDALGISTGRAAIQTLIIIILTITVLSTLIGAFGLSHTELSIDDFSQHG